MIGLLPHRVVHITLMARFYDKALHDVGAVLSVWDDLESPHKGDLQYPSMVPSPQSDMASSMQAGALLMKRLNHDLNRG